MAPKRAFGGVLRPFGGGFRGPNRERASVFSGAGRGRTGGGLRWSRGGVSVFSGAGRGRCRGFCGGAGAGPARSAVGPGAGRGGVEQAGVLRRRRGWGQRVQRRGIGAGRGVQRCRRDGPAAGSQKKCSEGKVRCRPGTKRAPKKRCAAARTHTGTKKRTSVRSLPLCHPTTLTLLPYGLLLRDARPIHPAARQRLRTPGARLFCGRLPAACSPATACLPSISVCPSVGGHSRESLRHPEPQPLSRPPVGAQPPGRRNLSRPGSPP